ncbi:class F sortase [Streptomyces sp. 8N706]|uniref:class F sortase n=1 Tax=Streptomyces sp. 8N706 TaxID=3457416 RepID=UPI003FD69AD7
MSRAKAGRTDRGGRTNRGGPEPESTGRWGTAAVITALLAGAWLLGGAQDPPPQPSASEAAAGQGPAGPDRLPGAPMSHAEPVRVRIPAIGVSAPVVRLSLDASGRLQTPPAGRGNLAGWYADGPSPGQRGNAVMAGHVDTARGRAVFFALGSLRRNHTIEVDRADGSRAVFAVDAVEIHSKDHFPDRRVYGPTTRPELRLITCGGAFSRTSGYQANVVVYAHLVRPGRSTEAGPG